MWLRKMWFDQARLILQHVIRIKCIDSVFFYYLNENKNGLHVFHVRINHIILLNSKERVIYYFDIFVFPPLAV